MTFTDETCMGLAADELPHRKARRALTSLNPHLVCLESCILILENLQKQSGME